ncbi:hypothetical protein MPSEU_000420100 [Mayamaea pseudoterrestris]|nr:hypothetical protein MPSEU_000420100 [Mayamaea pseudoterrestris]
MASLKKLPPHVARELRRHVSPRPLNERVSQQQQGVPASMKWIAGGCVALVGTAASFPLLATWWIKLNEKETPLTAAQARRGAFNNSGSRDVGKDSNWDFENGQYKKDAGYYAMYQEEGRGGSSKRMPGEFLSMPSSTLDKHEQKMKDFAEGRAKNNG